MKYCYECGNEISEADVFARIAAFRCRRQFRPPPKIPKRFRLMFRRGKLKPKLICRQKVMRRN